MGNHAVEINGRNSPASIVGLICWHIGANANNVGANANKGRFGRGSRLRRRLFVASAVFAVAVLAGCTPGHTTGKTTAPGGTTSKATLPGASMAAGPTPASASAPAGPTPSHTGVGAATECVTSAAKGNCGPYTYPAIAYSDGNTTVGQDVWNPIPGWSQRLQATSPGNWYVTAEMPAGNTAVVSYPNTGTPYGEKPLSSFHRITSSFSESMHAVSQTSAWAAFDLWFNNWSDEVMIQNDFAGNGPCPPAATHTFGGSDGVPVQSWNLCVFGSERVWKLAGNSGPESTSNEQSGSVDILSMLTWMENNGYLLHNSTVTDLSYGFEICSTGGKPETFTVSGFSISAA
jgi:hypothetical protein